MHPHPTREILVQLNVWWSRLLCRFRILDRYIFLRLKPLGTDHFPYHRVLNIFYFQFSSRSFSNRWDWWQLNNNLDRAETIISRKISQESMSQCYLSWREIKEKIGHGTFIDIGIVNGREEFFKILPIDPRIGVCFFTTVTIGYYFGGTSFFIHRFLVIL